MYHIPRRPGGVMAAAVLMIVYGSLMLTCGICGGVMEANADPAADAMIAKEVPAHKVLKYAETISNLFVGVAMIGIAVGVLQMAPFARYAAYLLCAFEILWMLVHSIFNVIFIFPLMERLLAEEAKNNPPAPFDVGTLVKGGMWFGLAIGILFTLAFLVPIIILLSTASARRAFAGEYDAEPPPDDQRPPRYGAYDDDDDYNPPPKPPTAPGDTGITSYP